MLHKPLLSHKDMDQLLIPNPMSNLNAAHVSRVLLGQLELLERMAILAKTVQQVKTELKEKMAKFFLPQLQQNLVPFARQVLLVHWEKWELKDHLGQRALQAKLALLANKEKRVWLDQKE